MFVLCRERQAPLRCSASECLARCEEQAHSHKRRLSNFRACNHTRSHGGCDVSCRQIMHQRPFVSERMTRRTPRRRASHLHEEIACCANDPSSSAEEDDARPISADRESRLLHLDELSALLSSSEGKRGTLFDNENERNVPSKAPRALRHHRKALEPALLHERRLAAPQRARNARRQMRILDERGGWPLRCDIEHRCWICRLISYRHRASYGMRLRVDVCRYSKIPFSNRPNRHVSGCLVR